jgi:DNA polymerase-3 subunit epsilon
MNFPLIVLDFEASSLSDDSYPIEVGVALAFNSDGPIRVWSSLIQPCREWTSRHDWDPAAERVHHIPASLLATGQTPSEVAKALNAIIGPVRHAYCDGGHYDGFWLERLFKAARIEPAFALWDLARLFLLNRTLFRRFGAILDQSAAPHRAGADAARLCAALVRAEHGVSSVDILSADVDVMTKCLARHKNTA